MEPTITPTEATLGAIVSKIDLANMAEVTGMDDKDAQALLDELVDFACQPPRTLTHRWQPGDVIVWDNRCVLHRARPYDKSRPRVLRHVRIAGEPETESATTGLDERATAFEPSASNR